MALKAERRAIIDERPIYNKNKKTEEKIPDANKQRAYRELLMECADRNKRMRALRSSGKTLTQIGRDFGISRQRVHQIMSIAA